MRKPSPVVGQRYHYQQNLDGSGIVEICEVKTNNEVIINVVQSFGYPELRQGKRHYVWRLSVGKWTYLEGQDAPE